MTNRLCSIDGCERLHEARGWCRLHYTRWKNHGDPFTVKPRNPRARTFCTMPGCDSPCAGRGLCHKHYMRWWSYGDPTFVMRAANADMDVSCSVIGCTTKAVAKYLCPRHYNRARKFSDPLVFATPPRQLMCTICDSTEGDPGGSEGHAARILGVARSVVHRHRTSDHDNDAEWHAKRAAWWVKELEALNAAVSVD